MQVLVWLSGIVALVAAAFTTPLTAVNEPKVVPREPVEMLVGGDLMFDRHIRKMMRLHGPDHVFSCLKDELADADLVVANLEGPVTTATSVSEGSIPETPENFTFTFAPEVVPLLSRHNITVVNLGNNHIMNFGRDGLLQTLSFLEEGGVRHFGNPAASNESDRVLRLDLDGQRFSFVSWSDWTGGTAENVSAQIALERASGRTPIVYTHWGDEYVPPSDRVRRLARRFAESGAAIVIGSHPHVVLEREDIAGVPVYYSLGNLIFDQYWEDAVRDGLLLRLRFAEGELVGVDEIPTRTERDGRVCLKSVE